MEHVDERQMCRDHGGLLEAIERAEHYAAGPGLLDPWAELGDEWRAFEREQKGGDE